MTPALLRYLRKRLKLTQKALATELGVSLITVNRWERGNAPIPKWADMAVRYLSIGRKRHVQATDS